MTRRRTLAALLFVAVAPSPQVGPAATVALNANVKYQTIRGWSCNPHYMQCGAGQREQVLDDAVHELGLTRMRWQQPNGNRSGMRRWEWSNDNGDPDDADLSKFNTADADRFIKAYVLPFKRRVEARGEAFELWLSPSFFDGGSTGSVPAFLLHSPGEYAEYATSFIQYLRKKYGVETNHYAICNEAGNNNAFRPAVVAEMTKVLGARMKALGLPTKGQFSDGVNAHVTWRYIQAAKNDPDVWKYVDVLSYHWYGGKNTEAMAKIRDFARQKRMDTAQTEFMRLTIDHLYDDLAIGGVSYWSIYGLGGPAARQNYNFHLNNTSFSRGRQFWNLRQVMHYVRPGAVRIEASCDDPALRALAFEHKGKTTVVLINNKPPNRARAVTVRGLPAGDYGACRSVGARPYQELGVKAADARGRLTVNVPAGAVLTLYPHPAKNLPPTVTDRHARPNCLTVPASRTTLSAAAQDPELDALSYSWSVTAQPAGAKAVLAAPRSATTPVTGLTAPGRYVFTVTVSDGASRIARDVLLNVYRGNQPPMVFDVHNRIPVLVTLPQDSTILIGGGRDLERDKLTFRWSVARQPAGASVRLETPAEQKCRASNIKVAGDHVFRCEVRDPAHTVSRQLTVPVYPVNSAPVIGNVQASPANVALPAGSTLLSAVTSDPDGDVITHWWRTARKPAGARPVFAKQGRRDTKVTGLGVPGRYVFTLTAVDRTKFARKDVAVTVTSP